MRVLIGLWLLTMSVSLAAQDVLPDGKGKDTLENTCAECHGLDRALEELRTSANWREIALKMRAKGATMTDAELETLVEYLSQNFGKEDARPKDHDKINVNQATAKELADALQLEISAAEAIVRYRRRNGRFKHWRELADIKSVDRAKIEANKDRLIF